MSARTVRLRGTGDADVYVRADASVTPDAFGQACYRPNLYAPFVEGSEATVMVTAPTTGTWFVQIEDFTNPIGDTPNQGSSPQ